MGHTTKSIPFFNQDIIIKPHTASHGIGVELDQKISIGKFAGSQRCSLEQIEDGRSAGEYIVRRQDGAFIQGKEV